MDCNHRKLGGVLMGPHSIRRVFDSRIGWDEDYETFSILYSFLARSQLLAHMGVVHSHQRTILVRALSDQQWI